AVLIILHPSVKLKMPSEATADVRVRKAAQSPVAVEAAPTSYPARPRKAHFSVTLYHESMETLLGLHLRPGRQFGWGWLDSPQSGPHGRGPPRVPGTDLWPLCAGIRTGGLRRSTLWCAHRLVYGRALTALTVLPAPPVAATLRGVGQPDQQGGWQRLARHRFTGGKSMSTSGSFSEISGSVSILDHLCHLCGGANANAKGA